MRQLRAEVAPVDRRRSGNGEKRYFRLSPNVRMYLIRSRI